MLTRNVKKAARSRGRLRALLLGFLLIAWNLPCHCANTLGAPSAEPAPTIQTPLIIVYPRSESSSDDRRRYPLAVLELALQKSGIAFELQPSKWLAQQNRNISLLARGRDLDIIWTSSARTENARLLDIDFPIDRGLLGWRLLLIRAQRQTEFSTINTLAELGKMRAGQGHDWPDLEILGHNHLRTSSSTTYDGLFAMLAHDHIDYFPRSIAEIGEELENHAPLDLAIESHLALHYSQSLHFLITRDNQLLHQAITRGLNIAWQDGSFMRLFYEFFGQSIASAQLDKRLVFELQSPYTEAVTQLPGLMFSPTEIKHD